MVDIIDVTDSTVATDMDNAQTNFENIATAISELTSFATTGYPDQTDADGKVLSTDGETPEWIDFEIENDTTPTLGGDLDLDGNTIVGAIDAAGSIYSDVKLQDVSETINALGTLTGGTDDIDLEDGNVVTAQISTAEQTFTFSNPPASGTNGSFVLFLEDGNSQTVNFPGTVVWSNGDSPSLTTDGIDVLVFTTNDAGTTWYGFQVGEDMQ